MALLSQASDLKTRQRVWVSTNTSTGEQTHSHSEGDYFHYDGMSAAAIAGMSAHAYCKDVRGIVWG
jgi:hypothetical protein